MDTDPTDPFSPPYDGGGTGDGEKDPMRGVVEPGWWGLVGGVWRWITEPIPNYA